MSATETAVPDSTPLFTRDFRLFFTGQFVSSLGNGITDFALPLLIYQITGSELGLGLAFAIRVIPYLLFGLPVGAWVDRLDRKKLMVVSDVLNGLLLIPIPILGLSGLLPVELIFVFLFLSSTLNLVFDTGQFAAVYSLVDRNRLVAANGRLRASFQITSVVGAPIVGLLVWLGVRLELILLIDAISFIVSAAALLAIRRSFNAPPDDEPVPVQTLLTDIREGLRFILSNPLMRATLALAAVINLTTTVIPAQLIAFGTNWLDAGEFHLGLLTAAGAGGAIILALSAEALRDRFSFSVVTIASMVAAGLLVVALSLTSSVWVALPFWGLALGMTILFNICLRSLQQQITPPRMMGRVSASSQVVTWAVIPVGALGGSWIADQTGRLDMVYLFAGLSMIVAAALFFTLSALRHPTRYTPEAAAGRDLPRATAPGASA
ncbi:MAG TPA: MFS transporter [Thermomicrobiales bacterium]|nr:MFS transporter [Thermomicrobiales bacterium]